MTTKERIIEESLSLFSEKGYAGTSVKNIADAVGIKDSSLYKHFKSKKEIIDTIIEEMEKRMANLSIRSGLMAGACFEEEAKAFAELELDGFLSMCRQFFLFYLKDEYVSRFWKLAVTERFSTPEIYALYQKIFIEDSILYQTEIFRELIRQGYFIKSDPETLAMSFFSPIFFLLSKYIGSPEKDELALDVLDKQIAEFYRLYRNTEKLQTS